MRDSDWSRAKILRSDWLLPEGAIITTKISFETTWSCRICLGKDFFLPLEGTRISLRFFGLPKVK